MFWIVYTFQLLMSCMMTFIMIDLYDFSEIKKWQEQGSILMG